MLNCGKTEWTSRNCEILLLGLNEKQELIAV
jgi:hypothetical protein